MEGATLGTSSKNTESTRKAYPVDAIPSAPFPIWRSRQLFDADFFERKRDELAQGATCPLHVEPLPFPSEEEHLRQTRCIEQGLSKNADREKEGKGRAHGSGKLKGTGKAPAGVILAPASFKKGVCKSARNESEYLEGKLDSLHGHWAVVAVGQGIPATRTTRKTAPELAALAVASHLVDAGLVPSSISGFACMDSKEPSIVKLLDAGCPLLYSDSPALEPHALLPSWTIEINAPARASDAGSSQDETVPFKVMAHRVQDGSHRPEKHESALSSYGDVNYRGLLVRELTP